MVIFPISIFSQIRSEGGGVIKYHFFPKFKIVHIILGGGGHENYGLFPQFGTFSFGHAPLTLLALLDIDSKRMHVVIRNFLTFPKYQKQKFWKNLN